MKHPEPEHMPMSVKRRAIYDYIAKAGPEGITKDEVLTKFFSDCTSETSMRTTIFNINCIIKPVRIRSQGQRLWLTRPDQ